MSSRFGKVRVSSTACRSGAETTLRNRRTWDRRPPRDRRKTDLLGVLGAVTFEMQSKRPRLAGRSIPLVATLLLTLLAVPSNALAQRDAFFSALLSFYKTLGGVYGDEGPQLVAQLGAVTTALEQWDAEIRAAETQLRPRLNGADAQTELQVHTLLASLY